MVTLTRKYLVFVRAGDDSFHPEWLAADPNRSWDCFVSYYGRGGRSEFGGEFFSVGGTNKFQHFQEIARRNPEVFFNYEHVWVADSDLVVGPGDISRLFGIASDYRLDLSQPSLSKDSFWSHLITLNNPHYQVRRTNFVEVMCPLFSRSALKHCLDSFSATKSTWGLDYLWPGLLGPEMRIAIIDALQVKHAKHIDIRAGAWYQRLQEMGVDANAERIKVLASVGRTTFTTTYHPFKSVPKEGSTRLGAFLRTEMKNLGICLGKRR